MSQLNDMKILISPFLLQQFFCLVFHDIVSLSYHYFYYFLFICEAVFPNFTILHENVVSKIRYYASKHNNDNFYNIRLQIKAVSCIPVFRSDVIHIKIA